MRLALGTAQFGMQYGIANVTGQVEHGEIGKILDVAWRAGINTLDTAIAYGNSEQELGAIGVDKWQVVTKLPQLPVDRSSVYSWATTHVRVSLARLQLERAYGVLLHRPGQLLEPGGHELFAALQDMKKLGMVEKIGVSVYAPEELDRLFDFAEFDIVQAPLSVLDRRLVETGWAGVLKRQGVEVHTRSAFLQGLLLMNSERRPTKFNRWHHIWKAWEAWLTDNGLSPLQACLRYPLSTLVDRVVVGVDSVTQLEEILQAAPGTFPAAPEWPTSLEMELLNPAMWNQI